jgi:hypothetical protein
MSKSITFRAGSHLVTLHFDGTPGPEVLKEARREELRGGYGVRKDPPHGGQGQYHFHLDYKGNPLISMNLDGSVHDNLGGLIPNKVRAELQARFKDFTFPANWQVESIEGFGTIRTLVEDLELRRRPLKSLALLAREAKEALPDLVIPEKPKSLRAVLTELETFLDGDTSDRDRLDGLVRLLKEIRDIVTR